MQRSVKQIQNTFLNFFQYESSSGIILFVMTILAFIISNSPVKVFYESFLEYKFKIGFENLFLEKSLLLWINDALMSFFFFLVGLEIKREILVGELKDIKRAILPVGAAIGGMLAPAVLFLLLIANQEGKEGWGIPMATDIAFSLSILKLLGDRIPLSSKVFLTAFAIIDDLGAIIIIAIFYSSSINYVLLFFAFGIVMLLILFNYFHLRTLSLYYILGIILWIIFLKSGIHPTISAVILAFTIPSRPKVNLKDFINNLENAKENLSKHINSNHKILLNEEQIESIEFLSKSIREVQSPLQKLENQLHSFVAFWVMPIFAFANAGVYLGNTEISTLSIYIAVSLSFGKLIGIISGVYIVLKLFRIHLPENTNWLHYFGLAFLGGVGFTMSLFINNLAYTEIKLIDEAKIGILLGSLFSGIMGYILIKFSLKQQKL